MQPRQNRSGTFLQGSIIRRDASRRVLSASRLACLPRTVQVTSQTSSGLHSRSSQRLGKSWLSLKYKQMELFLCTSKRAFELFIAQTVMTRRFRESSSTRCVSATGRPLRMDSGSLVFFCFFFILICIVGSYSDKTLPKEEHIASTWCCLLSVGL